MNEILFQKIRVEKSNWQITFIMSDKIMLGI